MQTRLPTYYLFYGCLLLALSGCSGCVTNWFESYRYDKQQPFDTYALYELLTARPEGTVVLGDSLAELQSVTTARANYVFVGSYAHYDEREVTRLLDFVERGNTAFIAAYELPEDLAYHLFGEDCYYGFYDDEEWVLTVSLDTVRMELANDDSVYTVRHVYNDATIFAPTRYLNYAMLCDSLLDNEVLGVAQGSNTNFVRLGWGEGSFYLHLNPVFFTNYYLIDSLQYGYARATLAVLNEGPVYWDETSKVPPTVARERSADQSRNYNGGRNLLTGNEALSYIQEQPPLAFAWYTLLLTVLLYVVFRGRRRQRIIPFIPRRENSSKRFIGTMSRLVLQKGRHIAIAKQEISSLRFHLQERYGLRWREGSEPPADLAKQVGVSPEVAAQALAEIEQVGKRVEMSEAQLLRFYAAIEPLYHR